ncbi:fibrinogen-like YCDxxxxGGGW domain-containing protein, partial [Arthrobacter sp. H14]|uniref:fibrinogen-like YCDxxxxGGGW domain-containing protein n=1 Tax=Arthrobacter sp. H14 TaxID=1312959 RepID=UPI0020A6D36B
MSGLSAPPPAVAAAAVDGSTESTTAASCWEIKQEHPSSPNGSYWLLTAEMDAPQRVYCDMTTDGGGWLLIGKGKQGWTENYEGKGRASDLQENGLSPMSGQTTQYSADVVDGLLNGEPVSSLSDGVRLKRARTADGAQWQEVRFSFNNRDRWVWTFGAAHRTASTSFDGAATSGGGTSNFGTDNAYNRVITGPIASQGYATGFAYGSGVTGSSDNSSHLWSRVNGAGTAMPYTEMYIRPKIRSLDAGFERIGDAGTDSQTNASVARSLALDSPWGVAGQGGPFQREGDVEVQAFVESGGLMYVGGNFRYAQRAAASTGLDQVEQPFLAAFNVNTGELVRGFTPSLNGSVMALAALPNGNIVAAGTFTEANGAAATAIVALDPDTGNTAAGWSVHVEDNRTSGVVNIRTLSVQGDWLYLAGGFTHVSGGSGALIYAQSAARVSVVDGTPGDGWRPTFNGTVVSADASDDGARLYAAGYFTTSQGAPAYKAAAVQTSANAPLATPAWNPVWSSANKDYQQSIGQVGDRVWVGGSEHSFFSYSTANFDRLSGNIGQRNGDFQAMTAGNGVVYAGCHCNNYNYSNSFTWPDQGSNWTQA